MTLIPAIPASKFTDGVGVDLHPNWPAWEGVNWQPLILDLGVKHTRGLLGHSKVIVSEMGPLFDAGVKHCATIVASAGGTLDKKASEANFRAVADYIGPLNISGLEGPNEFNHNHPANWASVERDFVKWMHDTVRSISALSPCKLIAPSIWGRVHADYLSLGNIDPYVDRGCIHYYTDTKPPTMSKVSLDQSLSDAHILTPKPLWATECGYDSTRVGDRLKAKYTIRLLFELLRRGVERAYVYELIDDATGHEWGLVTADTRTKRLAYSALKNTLALFVDGDSAPQPLDVSVSGPADLHSILYGKSDGSHLLVLLRDVKSVESDMAPVNVTVKFGSSVDAEHYQPTFSSTPRELGAGSSFVVPVSDHVSVVRIV